MSLGEEERIEQEFTQGICKGGKTSLYDTTTVLHIMHFGKPINFTTQRVNFNVRKFSEDHSGCHRLSG